MPTEMSLLQKDKYCTIHKSEVLRVVTVLEPESRTGVAGTGRRGQWRLSV